jgi:hypothetical protein
MTTKIKENDCGCDGGYEYAPVSEFDGEYGSPGEYNAASAVSTAIVQEPYPTKPTVVPDNVPTVVPEITVYIKDYEAVNGGVVSGDIIEFCINFGVSSYSPEGSSRSYTVKKRIAVSKQALFDQGAAEATHAVATMVESKPTTPVKQLGKSELQRAREIAGIPHSKNYL